MDALLHSLPKAFTFTESYKGIGYTGQKHQNILGAFLGDKRVSNMTQVIGLTDILSVRYTTVCCNIA